MREILCAALCVAAACLASADCLIGSPEMPPTRVDANGAIHEDWGAFELRMEGASIARQTYACDPMPTLVTEATAGDVSLTQTVYRAPIWPAGVDVLTARIEKAGAGASAVRLDVVLPDDAGGGECLCVVHGRPVVALPLDIEAKREMKAWGCTGGASAMPGWARPNTKCDPAFSNIGAGMGGVPIEYRFAVTPGEGRTVVLGLCESYWGQAGRRPLEIRVEGAPKAQIDPVAVWGQHTPGCLEYDARDENGDGCLSVAVHPHPNASDKNTILNVLWIFAPDAALDLEAVKAGAKSADAEYYVDVGGENDQTLYKDGPFSYEVEAVDGEPLELTFLLAACGGAVSKPGTGSWTPGAMYKAAADVWRDWWAQGNGLDKPEAEATRQALARIVLSRTEADGFCVALPEPGRLDLYSHAHAAEATAALDDAGIHDEAERLLRVYWDKPVPEAFARMAQGEDGQWHDASGGPCAQGLVLQALARHATATKDVHWAEAMWPSLKAGADWLGNAGKLEGMARDEAVAGLLGAAEVARLLGRGDEAAQLEEAATAIK